VLDEPRDRADAISVLDAGGHRVDLIDTTSGGLDTRRSFPLRNGRSVVLTVGAGATTLTFSRGGELVDSMPLDLVPGETILLRR